MAITLKDIAQKTEFDVSTVSRVLNGDAESHGISKSTQSLILNVANELGYRPNRLARGLRLKETEAIGMILPDISNPFFGTITKYVQEILSGHGYSLIINNSRGGNESEEEYIKIMRSWGVDGLIIVPSGYEKEHIKEINEEEIPFIFVDRKIKDVEVPSVTIDNYKGALKATKYLIDKGHKRIAVSQGSESTSTNIERIEGYKKALRESGISVDEDLIVGRAFDQKSGYKSTKKIMNTRNTPTAIIALSDMISFGVLRALNEEDINIPKNISVVSFDDIEFASLMETPLTTVSQPTKKMGVSGARLMLEMINDKEPVKDRSVVYEPALTVRESVKKI